MNNDFSQGIKHGIPIFLGYLAVSCAFGMRICAQGFPVWLAGLISFTNLTSAGQFAGTGLMIEGAPYIEIFVTTFIINIRYFLMALSLSQRLDGSFSMLKRLSLSHGITDEIFAVAIGRKSVSSRYMLGLILMPIIGWTSGTVLGGIFTQVLPQSIVNAMGIALYAMFVAIIIPPAKKNKAIAITVIAATALSLVFAYVPIFEWLTSGWAIIIIAIVVSAVVALLFPIPDEEAAQNG